MKVKTESHKATYLAFTTIVICYLPFSSTYLGNVLQMKPILYLQNLYCRELASTSIRWAWLTSNLVLLNYTCKISYSSRDTYSGLRKVRFTSIFLSVWFWTYQSNCSLWFVDIAVSLWDSDISVLFNPKVGDTTASSNSEYMVSSRILL